MRITVIISILFASIFLAFIPLTQAQISEETDQKIPALPTGNFTEMTRTGQGKVATVISPDTVVLDDNTVLHLTGMDILPPSNSNGEISPLTIAARDVLHDMYTGHRVNIYQTRDPAHGRNNRMGHKITHITRVDDDAWAQGTLIRLGLARVKTTPSNTDMAAQMLSLEAQSRAEKHGIWDDKAYPQHAVLSPDTADQAIGTYAIIQGKVESIATNKNRIYINFGKDWRTDFTVSIAPSDKRAFTNAGLNPFDWSGETIRARGYLRDYNGAYMEATHPHSIELLTPDTDN